MPAPIKVEIIDGQHFVVVEDRKRFGPYDNESEAEVMAAQFGSIYRLFQAGGLPEIPTKSSPALKRQ